MGMIRIELRGSFGGHEKTFSAMERGHAMAIAEAIQWLAEVQLPAAIQNDHICHRDGEFPKIGFGKPAVGKPKPPETP